MKEPLARILSSRTVYRSRYFRLTEDVAMMGRRRFTYQFRPHGKVVHIVALTARGEVVLERQYRHPVRKWLLEIPAGSVDPGEAVLEAARRELMEETGYSAKRWEVLGGWYPSPASTDTRAYLVLATGARKVRKARPEPSEFLRVVLKPFAEALRMAGREKEGTVFFHLGLLLAALHLGRRYNQGPGKPDVRRKKQCP
jgi:ADP-ribose pyrophosphatase